MNYITKGAWLVAWFLAGAAMADGEPVETVRVAAIQCYSEMGHTASNTSNLVSLVRQAAAKGARIIVTPECALQGYLFPPTWRSWSGETNETDYVGQFAETIPGPATRRFSDLCKETGVYLCLGLVEAAGGKFHNSQVLIAPDGAILAHHRKKSLWTPGDAGWCAKGDREVAVVDSPYGRLGLMICYDFHDLPPELARANADIVLYSVGWYGPNEKIWFQDMFPRKAVIPHGFHVVAANWSGPNEEDAWPGRGYSCILSGKGRVMAMADTVVGNEIVIADLPVQRRSGAAPAKPTEQAPAIR